MTEDKQNKRYKTLDELKEGDKFIIKDYLSGHGLRNRMENMARPGSIIEIVSKQPFRGPIILQTNNHEFGIGYGMARKILVEEYENEKNIS